MITTDKILKSVSTAISAVTSPLLVPTYAVWLALWLTSVSFAPLRARLVVLGMAFALTCMVPIIFIFLLSSIKVIRDPLLNDQKDRQYPLIISILCYLALAFFLPTVSAPAWLAMFMWGASVAALLMCVINIWWKISGHAIVMGALTALSFYMCLRGDILSNTDNLFYFCVILSGIVMTARLILGRHTFGQVIAGYVLGFIVIAFTQTV